jgi:hypothetical protein
VAPHDRLGEGDTAPGALGELFEPLGGIEVLVPPIPGGGAEDRRPSLLARLHLRLEPLRVRVGLRQADLPFEVQAERLPPVAHLAGKVRLPVAHDGLQAAGADRRAVVEDVERAFPARVLVAG